MTVIRITCAKNLFKISKWVLILCVCFFFSNTSGYARQNHLVQKAKELVYSNPDEAIKIGEHILKTNEKKETKADISVILARSYFVKGNFNSAITNAFNADAYVDKLNHKTQIDISLLKAELFRLLYLDNQYQKELSNADSLIKKIANPKIHDSLASHLLLERVSMNLERRETDKALSLLNETNERYQNFINSHPVLRGKLFIAKEKALSNLTQYDSAFVYLNKALTLISSNEYNNLYEKAQVYNQLGYLHLQKKAFSNSEETLFIALKYAEILDNPILLEQINRNLAINYLASNQKIKHKVYNDEFLVLNNRVDLAEQETINTVYNIISNQNEQSLNQEQKKYSNFTYIALGMAFLLVLLGVFFVVKSQWKKKRLKEIIKYLEISRNNFIKTKPSKKIAKRRVSIPEETEKNLLAKLKRFEASTKFLNKDMSLAVLSGQFETNTKYLSEIIHRHYNDNFNTFINKLRINYIIEKLKNDSNYMNYKISFLAEESGFSSHSSFATVFKSIIGMSPATFINLLKTERENNKNKNQ